MSGLQEALRGVGLRHREPLMLLRAELDGLGAAEQAGGRPGLPDVAQEFVEAAYAFLLAYCGRELLGEHPRSVEARVDAEVEAWVRAGGPVG